MDAAKTLFDQLAATADDAQFQKGITALSRVLKSEDACVQVVTSNWAPQLVHFLVQSVMNSAQRARSAKFEALSCLLSLSSVPDKDFRERLLFAQVARLDHGFEDLLDQNEKWQKDNGFGLGRQHEQVVVLLMRCTGYKLSAADLLHHFCSNNLAFLLHLLISIFSRQFYELDVQEATLRCLFELSLPQTYFRSEVPSAGEEVQFAEFEKHIDLMIETSMRLAVTQSLAKNFAFLALQATDAHFQARWARIMRRFASMFLNLVRFTTNARLSTTWRQMVLVTDQELFTVVILPHITASGVWLAQRLRSPPPLALEDASDIVGAFSACLRFLTVAAFRVSVSLANLQRRLRKQLVDATHPLLDFPPQFQKAHLSLYAHLLQCHANLDTLVAPPPGAQDDGSDAATGVSQNDRLLLVHGLRTFFSILHSSRTTSAAYSETSLQLLFKLVSNAAEARFVSLESVTYRTIDELAKQVPATVALVAAESSADVVPADLSDEELDRMAAQLDQQIEELERAVDDAQQAKDLLEAISPHKNDAPTSSGGAHHSPEGSLLGDLPPIVHAARRAQVSAPPTSTRGGESKSRRRRTFVPRCPPEFLCHLTHKMMQHPVRLPNGNVYEQSVLESVVAAIGHVDPVTGEALNYDLDVDLPLQRRILEFSMKQCIATDGEAF